ncbi:MAG: hypothetical protein SPK50_07060 [Mobiluncus porci]|uniref:ATP synthase I chain n=1 Tax=Mobiluncus porci TaxID=2652278 RepID=A0A7K0K192_9ACTO|nr:MULTISPECIES: hypothetical protein [Mobiluncus]MCI6584113.1 hypothetical protein [Mobiluncus sp.]MDD7541940.1 hypothetical protein [Mobiluncus porci]MDY5748873.1 hypothetical protein [Mobiluncus porci]MST49189.1 hypothetical protein [Mobiluncus porci]
MSKPEPPPENRIGPLTKKAVKYSLKFTALAMLVTLILAALIAALATGIPGLKAVGLSAAAGAAMMLATAASHTFTINHPDLMMAGMGGDFLCKILILLGTLAVARAIPDLNPMVIFLTMLALILVQTVAFPVAVTRARVPLLDPPEDENS